MIGIIDYGVGNLFSLSSSLKHIGCEVVISNDEAVLKKASHIILPGVGAFEDAYAKLEKTGLIPFINEQVSEGKPFLGICLGLQLMFEESYEYGVHKGLGLIEGNIVSIKENLDEKNKMLKVPHIGWNCLEIKEENKLIEGIKDGDYVYFVHSYCAADCESSTVATANYGISIPAIVAKENVYGCQFHPEKSGTVGLNILKNFSKI